MSGDSTGFTENTTAAGTLAAPADPAAAGPGKRGRRGLVGGLLGALVAPLITVAVAQPALAQCSSIPSTRDLNVTRTVYQVGRDLNVSNKVMLSGFEAGWVESHMNNLPCGDADSVGVFQQRAQWYGSKADRMNVRKASKAYFTQAKVQAKNHPGFSAGQVAQSVQRSAFPGRYDQNEAKAKKLLAEVSSNTPSGAIGTKWRAAGGDNSKVGTPRSGERDAANGGRYQLFSKGVILWKSKVGAFQLYGGIKNAFYAAGDEHKLGFPTADEKAGGTSPKGTKGRYQIFQKKWILWSGKTSGHVIEGAILTYFRKNGHEQVFGYPTSNETKDGAGVKQTYEMGTMRWTSAKGVTWTANKPAGLGGN